MELSPRLEQIYFHIPQVRVLADIGTDHGQLPIAAALRGRVRQAIGIDRSAPSLEKARAAVEEHRLQGRIQLRQGEGLTPLRTGEADCIVVAGMGGGQIVKILSANLPVWANARLLLQPNRDVDELRGWLYDRGVVLSTESLVAERGRYYTILVAQRGPQHMRDMAYYVPGWPEERLHIVGPHILREGGATAAAYYAQGLERAQAELAEMPAEAPRRAEQEARVEALAAAVKHLAR